MIPHQHIAFGFLGAAMLGAGLLREAPSKTEILLRRLDEAERKHLTKLASPEYHAAIAKRERRKAKLLGVA